MKPARTLVLALLALAAALAALPAGASAGTRVPTVSSVAPLKLAIGDTLTIRGKNFRPGKNKNTVVFKRDGQRAVFVTAAQATTTQLLLVVPTKLATYLSRSAAGTARPSRFRLRVLSARFGKAFTSTKLSPTISETASADTKPIGGAPAGAITTIVPSGRTVTVPVDTAPDCDGDGVPNSVDTDDDNDFLSDTLEHAIGTDSCNADTDGDGMQDGWEYESARQLNSVSCPATEYPVPCSAAQPYPRKRPYTNPLDGTDAGESNDGDVLTAAQEYTAWLRHPGHNLTPAGMWYSDGLQASQDSDPNDGCRGITAYSLVMPTDVGVTLPSGVTWTMTSDYANSLDLDGDGCLSDDERDEDGDMLTNYDETVGRMTPAYWAGEYVGEIHGKSWDDGTDWLDPDTDGDGTIDGLDDQDHDDFLNIEELTRGLRSVTSTHQVEQTNPDGTPVRNSAGDIIYDQVPDHPVGTHGLWVDPFDSCEPYVLSRTCPRMRPIGTTWTIEDQHATDKWPVWTGGPATTHLIPRPY